MGQPRIQLSHLQSHQVYTALQVMDLSEYNNIAEVTVSVRRQTGIEILKESHVSRMMRELGVSVTKPVSDQDKMAILGTEFKRMAHNLGFSLSAEFVRAFGGVGRSMTTVRKLRFVFHGGKEVEIDLDGATAVNAPIPTYFAVEQSRKNEGRARMTWNARMFPDMKDLDRIEMVREDEPEQVPPKYGVASISSGVKPDWQMLAGPFDSVKEAINACYSARPNNPLVPLLLFLLEMKVINGVTKTVPIQMFDYLKREFYQIDAETMKRMVESGLVDRDCI